MPRSTRLLVALALVAASLAGPEVARACGGFFRRPAAGGELPSLEVEQSLIAWDDASETEHFIREVTFRAAKEPFGFVVPTPSRPTVSKVVGRPFTALARAFPFREQPAPARGGGKAGGGGPSGGGAPAVQVLSRERIGSFTAFVLRADDSGALRGWLSENGFGTTPASAAWLEHYVASRFFFVAFRYEPQPSSSDALASETVDIAFATPAPYYPYREPAHPSASSARAEERAAMLWFVSRAAMQPVAAFGDGSRAVWKRPFAEGKRYDSVEPRRLTAILGPELATKVNGRARELVVQTFQDQKTSRSGFGDVVFVPESSRSIDAATAERLRPLASALAPARGAAR